MRPLGCTLSLVAPASQRSSTTLPCPARHAKCSAETPSSSVMSGQTGSLRASSTACTSELLTAPSKRRAEAPSSASAYASFANTTVIGSVRAAAGPFRLSSTMWSSSGAFPVSRIRRWQNTLMLSISWRVCLIWSIVVEHGRDNVAMMSRDMRLTMFTVCSAGGLSWLAVPTSDFHSASIWPCSWLHAASSPPSTNDSFEATSASLSNVAPSWLVVSIEPGKYTCPDPHLRRSATCSATALRGAGATTMGVHNASIT
mmetsp:Transcript_11199/g.35532  ORF Transcript_11199/g.35532 Transcript_11199/m.35532 type:complete len:257 (-) Transcript_11199:37-807(-)